MEHCGMRVPALAAVLLLFMTAGMFAQQGESVDYNGHNYVLYESGLSWTEAKRFCEEQGGHLATISSRGEQNAIWTLVKSGSKKMCWIGGQRHKTMHFRWLTGEKFSYTNWDTGAPGDNNIGDKDAIMLYKSTGRWKDENGEKPGGRAANLKNYGFVCEWDGPMPDDSSSAASGSATAGSDDSFDGMGICLDVGDKLQLFAPEGVKWVSSNPGVVKVNSRGMITGVSEGSAVITARNAGSVTVRVEQ